MKLQTMNDSTWTVRIDGFPVTYIFSRGGTVRWRDSKGSGGSGTWRIEGGKMITRWQGDKLSSFGAWNLPLDTDGTTGTVYTERTTFDLIAKLDVVDVGTFIVRSDQAKRNFLDKCDLAGGILQESQLVFTAWLSGISISYGRAFTSHTNMVEVVKRIRETEDLAAKVLLDLALTFLAGGVGGLVSGAMKSAAKDAKQIGDFMVDGVKDLAKFAVKGTGGAEIGVFANKGKGIQISGMPVSPLEWQNSVNKRVASEMAVVAKAINEWRMAVMEDNVRFDSSFDPAVEVDKALVLKPDLGSAVRLKQLPALNDDAMLKLQHQFEQGWFAGWIPQAKFAGERSFTFPNGNYQGREDTRKVLLSYGYGIDFDDTGALVDKYCPHIEKPFPPR